MKDLTMKDDKNLWSNTQTPAGIKPMAIWYQCDDLPVRIGCQAAAEITFPLQFFRSINDWY
jgi:hypothetical protein